MQTSICAHPTVWWVASFHVSLQFISASARKCAPRHRKSEKRNNNQRAALLFEIMRAEGEIPGRCTHMQMCVCENKSDFHESERPAAGRRESSSNCKIGFIVTIGVSRADKSECVCFGDASTRAHISQSSWGENTLVVADILILWLTLTVLWSAPL